MPEMMMRFLLLMVRFFVFLVLATAPTIHAQVSYYVSPAGNDLDTGTSIESAWQTIQRAADALQPGDTVFVLAGTYDESITMANDGTSAARITYQNLGAETVILTRDLTVPKDYITVKGFQLSGSSLWLDGSYCRVMDNYIHHSAVCGMFIHGTYNLISGNKIANNGAVWGDQISTGWGTGDIHHIVFEYNEVSDEEGQGEDLMQYLSHDFLVRGNLFHHLGSNGRHNDVYQSGGGEYNIWMISNRFEQLSNVQYYQMGDGDHDHVWRNNLFYGNIGWGFNGTPAGMRVVNNTFSLTGPNGGDNGNWGVGSVGKAINNIFSPAGSDGHGGDVDYNCVYPAPCCSAKGDHDLWDVDPLYVDQEQFDFKLQPSSPCIDAGIFPAMTIAAGSGMQIPVTDAALFVDGFGITHGDSIQLQGQGRIVEVMAIDYVGNVLSVSEPLEWTEGLGVSFAYKGIAPDIGAFEFSSMISGNGAHLDSNEFEIYPNPAGNTIHLSGLEPEGQQMQIFNVLGMLVCVVSLDSSGYIDISALSKGIYMLRSMTSPCSVSWFVKD